MTEIIVEYDEGNNWKFVPIKDANGYHVAVF